MVIKVNSLSSRGLPGSGHSSGLSCALEQLCSRVQCTLGCFHVIDQLVEAGDCHRIGGPLFQINIAGNPAVDFDASLAHARPVKNLDRLRSALSQSADQATCGNKKCSEADKRIRAKKLHVVCKCLSASRRLMIAILEEGISMAR